MSGIVLPGPSCRHGLPRSACSECEEELRDAINTVSQQPLELHEWAQEMARRDLFRALTDACADNVALSSQAASDRAAAAIQIGDLTAQLREAMEENALLKIDLTTERSSYFNQQRLRQRAELEAENQTLRECIAELSRRPTLEQWRQLCASAARPLCIEEPPMLPISHRACQHCGTPFLAEVLAAHEATCDLRPKADAQEVW